MAVYGYVRVSTQRQADEGESLSVQQRQLEGYATMLGLAKPKVFVEEGVSGTKPLGQRPAGAKLLAALRLGDVIICPKLDRMFRSALGALQMVDRFKQKGVALHLIDLGGDIAGNGISKLFFTIISAVAEAERDRISLRVAEVKADQRRRGRHLGGVRPFGHQIDEDGTLVPDPQEQHAIDRMTELREEGLSLRQIEAAMAQVGIQISHVAINRALTQRAQAKARR